MFGKLEYVVATVAVASPGIPLVCVWCAGGCRGYSALQGLVWQSATPVCFSTSHGRHFGYDSALHNYNKI